MPLSGTAAKVRQAGCKSSGENKRKSRGKGRLSTKLARNQQVGSGFSPGFFAYFHCARKLAIFRSQRSTRGLLEIAYQVITRGVGAGASGPCRRARERAALEPFPLPRQIPIFRSCVNRSNVLRAADEPEKKKPALCSGFCFQFFLVRNASAGRFPS